MSNKDLPSIDEFTEDSSNLPSINEFITEEVQEDFWEENNTLYEGCTYIEDKAKECINSINQSNCGELWTNREQINETCGSDVWSCS